MSPRPVPRSMGRTLCALMLLGLATAGCAAPSAPSAPPVQRPAITPPPEVEVPAPTTAPPTRGVDVALGEIRSAPAACGLPEHHLTAYRGEVGRTETLLQVDDGYNLGMSPVEPVEADVTGDGGLDLVGVLSCTVDGEARADSIVLYTGPATPAGSLDLARAQKEKLAVVRNLRTIGGEVRVYWTAFDTPSSPGTQYEGTVAWRRGALVLEDRKASSGPRTVTVEDGAFMTADGNVRCIMHGAMAWCDVSRTSWRPPSSPPPSPSSTRTPAPTASATGLATSTASPGSPSATAGDCSGRVYGRTFLIADGRARQTCAGEEGPEVAVLGAPLTTWHRRGWDATVTVDGRRSAALTPGSSMETSAVSCRASATTVTCTDTRTQATFTVGRTVSRVSTG